MTRLILSAIAGVAALAAAPLAEAPVRACRAPLVEGTGIYPDHALSPAESFRVHDAVFWAEVTVPARPCSLGTCAGLNVIQVLKGHLPSKVLVQVEQPLGTECPATLFTAKNSRWIIFANTGTSRTGYAYFQVEDDGPTFISPQLPNLQALEGRFRRMRARLDEVISERLGTLR